MNATPDPKRQLAGRIGEAIGQVVEIDCACHRTSQDAEMEAGLEVLGIPEFEWLRQLLDDLLNTDIISTYQREILGPVPAALLRWARADDDDRTEP